MCTLLGTQVIKDIGKLEQVAQSNPMLNNILSSIATTRFSIVRFLLRDQIVSFARIVFTLS